MIAQIGEDDIEHDENAAPKLVKHVADVLEEQGGQTGINLFKFIINPESYTQTVENIFFTSFLIKDRRAAIDYDDNDEPYICKAGECLSFDYPADSYLKQTLLSLLTKNKGLTPS